MSGVETNRRARVGAWMALAAAAVAAGCGGGGGGVEPPPPPPAPASCTNDPGNFVGVCTGFTGDLDYSGPGDGGGDGGGAGDGGASGDGGTGAGGDFGQFRNVTITAYRNDGAGWVRVGSAPTDDVKGMVTIRPGRRYTGPLMVELTGGANAQYFEEGKNTFVPFPAGRVIRTIVPRVNHNIGLTPFTEAAYQLLTSGSADESVSGVPTPAQIAAANARVATLLNEHFPKALEVKAITKLPFIKSASVQQGALGLTDRGIYGVVNGAFSKQAALYNTASTTPTLDAVQQLAEDLRDGKLDGYNANRPAANAANRSYDPQTLTSELTAALAHQAERFGNQAIRDALPKLVNYGGTRYEGYLFDSSVTRNRGAVSTVAGWLAANTLNLNVGQANNKLLPPGQSAHSMIGNMGHGGAFFKIDSTDTVNGAPVYRTYALGDNVNGELGTGGTTSTARQLVEISLPGAMTHAAGGFAHTVFRLGDGRVFAVGDNTFGQLGQGSGSTAPARSLTPLEVPLPAFAGGAVAVAATSVASYALMADGSVYAWGSNGGFGLLGNGQASGMVASPTLVVGLSEIVQLSARDNDVIALKRDQSIWQWGSHPADENGAYNDGDVTSPYRGGTLTPTQVNGLPTWQVNGRTVPIPVRKILTEQGLFGALLANGHVYTWGVHFDLSAKAILRDLTAARVFGAPPLRDVMPGGFVGYGARPFDRLTAMGVDYSGGMWKIRGRVAERFDPDNPTIQRRPQTGVPRSANCASCHTFLDETLEQLRVRQAAEAPVAPGAATCAPPPNVHVGTNGVSFIRAETECIQCHNPSRVDPRYAGQVAPAFAASGGWPNCNKPTDLPPRDNVPAAPITNSCSIPVGHVYTPPGTVCSSCHNSVAARALQDLNPPCAQPGSNELPTLAATAAIVSVTEDAGTAIAQGAYTRETTPQLNGTLSTALSGSQLLAVQRNGTAVGNASVSGTSFTFVDPAAPQGTAVYAVRVVQGSGFGATSNTWTVRVDSVAPSAVPAITALVDDTFGTVADGGFTTDSTPTLNGTLSAAPGTGEVLQVLRNGTAVGTATVTGTTWTYAEPSPLTAGSYTWAVRLADAAGNTGTGAQTSASLLGGVAGASISTVVNNSSLPIAQGSVTADNTPDLRGTLTAALPAGHLLRVLRNGSPVGSLSAAQITGTTWAYTDPAPDGAVSYTVRVEAGAVVGAESAAYAFSIDSTAPTQPVNVTQIADSFIGNLTDGATTADQTPTTSCTLSPPLAGGEQVRLRRTHTGTGAVVDQLFAFGGTNFAYTEPALVADGTYRYEALVIDAAGNTGPTTGGTRSVRIDPTAVPLPGAAATITTINGVAPASPINDNTPTLGGTLQRALQTGEVVQIFRDNGTGPAPVGTATATVGQSTWSYTNTTLADATYTFTAQVQQSGNSNVYGQMSAAVVVTVDTTAPTQTIATMGVFDDNSAGISPNTTDTTPRLSGTLSAAIGGTDTLELTRTGGAGGPVVRAVLPSGVNWTLTEAGANTLVVGATYTYTLLVRDAAGNPGASAQRTVTVVAPLPTVNTIGVSGAVGGFVGTTAPLVVGSISAGLPVSPAGAVVRVFRGGVSIGTATVVNTTAWSITDSTTTTQTARTYTARVELGTAYSATSAGVAVTPDTTTGTTVSALNITADAAPFNNTVGADADTLFNSGTTSDARPRIVVQLSGALSTGTTTSAESIQLTRNGAAFAFSATTCPAGLSNAVCFTDNTQSTTLTSTPTVLTTTPAPGTVTVPSTGGLPTGGVVYRARVVDAVSNQTALVATGTIVTDYVNCNQLRATAANSSHITIATYTGSCLGCHKNYTGVNTNAPTPSGTIIPVPQTLPVYFCRKP
jgi:Bacterial Ig-like domain/Regulator of chromosome condensation (RCC1) repeat